MRQKVLLGLSSLFLLTLVLSFGVNSHVFAQDDTPTLYEEDVYVDPYEETLYEDDFYYEDDLYYNTTEEISDEDAIAAFTAFLVTYFAILACVMIPVYIYFSFSLMTIGKKVGEGSGWMAWVPIVNAWYMVKVADQPWWMFLLLFVPFVNFFVGIYVWMKMAERRGFESWIGILMIVPFVGFLIPGYLAWFEPSGSSKGSDGDSPAKKEEVDKAEVEAPGEGDKKPEDPA